MSTLTDCASCADERGAGAAFCESCGRTLATGADKATGTDCAACGATGTVGDDGYCGNCGMLAGRPRDHVEADGLAVAAAVSDRGLRHRRNEDAMWLAVRGSDVDVVVCDGVSASFDPDIASQAAAETAGKVLAGPADDPAAHVSAAVIAAADAVAALADSGDPRRALSNPACTIVTACRRGDTIGYAWVGDSRAYWVPDEGDARQLTEDDSWARHAIELGTDPQVAWAAPDAHAITAWLGADAGVVRPHTGTLVPDGPGVVVLCTDGLWNYLPETASFADVVRIAVRGNSSPLAAARALVSFAVDAGGSDNITVALIPAPTPMEDAP